jgi:uncharacterized protein
MHPGLRSMSAHWTVFARAQWRKRSFLDIQTRRLEMFESQSQDDLKAYMSQNEEFKRLLLRHRELDRVVNDAEIGVNPVDDLTLVSMKKEKLRAKDRLTSLWQQRSH